MTTSFILVSWNVREKLAACLRSIQTYAPSSEVVVVDNASLDGSADHAASVLTTGRVIRNDRNRGFAVAVNQGIAATSGDLVVLLNPDTEIGPTTVDAITRGFDGNDPPAVVGVGLRNPDGSVQPSVRRFPRLADQTLILLKLHRVFTNAASIRRYMMRSFDYTKAADVDQVMGACFAFRRGLISQIGTFDEGYYLWYEEVDFCRRVAAHGMRVRYIPEGTVTHQFGASFSQVPALRRQRWFTASMRRYFRTWKPQWQWLIVCLLTPLSLAIAACIDGSRAVGDRGRMTR